MSIKLAIGLPAYKGIICAQQALMWAQLGSGIARLKWSKFAHGDTSHPDKDPPIETVMHGFVDVCGVDRARNILVAQAMQNNADWLLMIDSDTWVDKGYDLLRMIEGAPLDAALVGAAVMTVAGPNVYRWDALNRRHEMIDIDNRDAYQRVDAIGGAVIAIKLAAIGDADFRWHYYENGGSISEDLWFCRQLAQLKRAVYVDTRIRTFHNTRPTVMSSP